MKVIETSTSKVYLGEEDGENIFVFIVNDEYGNDAYGFRYSVNDTIVCRGGISPPVLINVS